MSVTAGSGRALLIIKVKGNDYSALAVIVRKAIRAAHEKYRDGLLTAAQLSLVIRMLKVLETIKSDNRNERKNDNNAPMKKNTS